MATAQIAPQPTTPRTTETFMQAVVQGTWMCQRRFVGSREATRAEKP